MTKLQEKILNLRKNGKTYQEIVDELKCSKSLVCYYCGNSQRKKANIRQNKLRKTYHPYIKKLNSFIKCKPGLSKRKISTNKAKTLIIKKLNEFTGYSNMKITLEQLIAKFSEKPRCYLTGQEIDIYDTKTYEFDHKIPTSKNGPNTIDNLGICIRQANRCKQDLTPEEFIDICKKILSYNGYTITASTSEVESENPLSK